MTSVKEWIEEKINNGFIHCFKYNEFSHIDEIGEGGFGEVSKANLDNIGLVALKTIISKNSKQKLYNVDEEFVKEVGIAFFFVIWHDISLVYLYKLN
jgi:hypothetical protein